VSVIPQSSDNLLTPTAVAKVPVEWQLPKVWVVSTMMGLCLAAGTWVMRATLFVRNGGIIQNFGSIQEVLFLEVALTESWVIFITRMSIGSSAGGFVWPSWQLVGAVFGVDVLATIFCLFGWVGGPAPTVREHQDTHSGWVDIVTVVRVWLFSAGVIVVVALIYFVLSKIKWLDNLGRITRHKKNTKLENFLTELQRLTLVHESHSDDGSDHYRFAPGASSKPSSAGPKESKKAKISNGNGKEKGDAPKGEN